MTGMAAVFRNEVLKARKRRALWVVLAIFLIPLVGDSFDQVRREFAEPEWPFSLPDDWAGILGYPLNIGPFFLGVLVILLFAPEFQWRTARQNIIDGMSKDRFYAGKLMVLGLLAAAFFTFSVAIGGGAALLSPGDNGPDLLRSTDLSLLRGFAFALLLVGSGSVMLAATVRASGPAMGLLFGCMLMEQFAGLILSRFDSLKGLLDYLPFRTFQILIDSRFHYPERLAETNAQRAQAGAPPLEFPDAGVVTALALSYVAAFLAIGYLAMRKRDL